MSKEELNEFKVSAIFQNRLITALKGEKESHIELANEIGISKDILIRALNTGVIPGTRSLIKLADYTEESIDYLIGLIDTTFYAKSLDYINFQDIPSLELIYMLAQYFNVTMDYLLGRTDDR